jgi:hypothetical protein
MMYQACSQDDLNIKCFIWSHICDVDWMYQCVKSITEKYWDVAVYISFACILYIEMHNSSADILQMWLWTFLLLTFSRSDSAHFFYCYSQDMTMHVSVTAVFQTWQCTFLLLILSISFTDILQLQTNPDLHRQCLWTRVTWKWLM